MELVVTAPGLPEPPRRGATACGHLAPRDHPSRLPRTPKAAVFTEGADTVMQSPLSILKGLTLNLSDGQYTKGLDLKTKTGEFSGHTT